MGGRFREKRIMSFLFLTRVELDLSMSGIPGAGYLVALIGTARCGVNFDLVGWQIVK